MSSFEIIRKLTAEISGVEPDNITLDTKLHETLDSIEIVYLYLDIDEKIEIEVDNDSYLAAKTVGDVVRIVDGALIATGEYCPICAVKFQPDDVCATDITEGTVHAACLEGAPVVDLDTSETLSAGKLDTFRYGDDEQAAGRANSNSGYTAEQIIAQIAQISTGVGFQSGTPALEMAGQIVSVLAAHPEHIERFMAEGTELLIDRTLSWEKGCLTYRARNGQILHPSDLVDAEGHANG